MGFRSSTISYEAKEFLLFIIEDYLRKICLKAILSIIKEQEHIQIFVIDYL